jgi:hypothetical protein
MLPSQQPEHEDAVQVQSALTHSWVELQLMHGSPPIPQAASTFPGMHSVTPLAFVPQHPAQVEGLHCEVCSSQVPLSQTCEVWHRSQVSPPVPQAVSLVPLTQFPLASQQPSLQVDGPHWTDLHALFSHTSPAAHFSQGLPPVPHAPGFVPGIQTLLKQQPLGQISLQGFAWQTPDVHCC